MECRAELEVRSKLQVQLEEINPHMDVMPTGKPEIQLRSQVLRLGEKDKETSVGPLACVYNHLGQCKSTLSVLRLKQLAIRHCAAGGDSTHFAADIMALMNRYKDKAINKEPDKQVRLKNHWACPDRLMWVLREHLHLDGERFASPLNVNWHSTEYWTAFSADSAFGARHDAFSEPWTGATEANPEYEHSDMDAALTWAFYSADRSTEPSFTVMVLPHWGGRRSTAYQKWLTARPGTCHLLATLPKTHYRFNSPDAWTGTAGPGGYPKWDIIINVVANQQGWEAYAPRTAHDRAAFKAALELFAEPKNQGADKCYIDVRWPDIAAGGKTSSLHKKDMVPGCPKRLRKLLQQSRGGASSTVSHTRPEIDIACVAFPFDLPGTRL